MDIFKWLNNSLIVKDFKINTFRKSETSYYLNAEVEIIDLSKLFVKEYFDTFHRKYSFHWQSENGDLIIRWDNAPHFNNLPTFPHHKHIGNKIVEESFDISFDEIMTHIFNHIST